MHINKQITKFISALIDKNYSDSHKYLRAINEQLLRAKIARAVKTTKLF